MSEVAHDYLPWYVLNSVVTRGTREARAPSAGICKERQKHEKISCVGQFSIFDVRENFPIFRVKPKLEILLMILHSSTL